MCFAKSIYLFLLQGLTELLGIKNSIGEENIHLYSSLYISIVDCLKTLVHYCLILQGGKDGKHEELPLLARHPPPVGQSQGGGPSWCKRF